METIIITAANTRNNGNPDQKSGCAWDLFHYDDEGRTGRRTISQPLGNCTLPLAQVNVARLGLASIVKKFRKHKVTLLVSTYVHDILVGGKQPKKNKDEIDELRRWVAYFTDLKVELVPQTRKDSELQELAKECAKEQVQSDTGTNVQGKEDSNRLAPI